LKRLVSLGPANEKTAQLVVKQPANHSGQPAGLAPTGQDKPPARRLGKAASTGKAAGTPRIIASHEGKTKPRQKRHWCRLGPEQSTPQKEQKT